MLTNEQVDELEAVIFGASMENLPLVLGKAIPLLFAELRVVRATLDSKETLSRDMPDDKEGTTDGGSDQAVRGRALTRQSPEPLHGLDKPEELQLTLRRYANKGAKAGTRGQKK